MTSYKKPSLADDLLDSIGVGATPVKRPRPSAASHSHGTPHLSSYRPSTPLSSSASRPLAPGPSRLNSSPRGPNATASSPATAAPSVPFLLRPNPFDLQEFLNSHLSLSTPAQNAGSAVRTKLFSRADPKAYMYRYMYERMMDRSEVLDKAIDDAADVLREYYQIDEYGDPSVQSQEDIIAVGRLCPETDAIKMTDTSTWLESSRMLGSGSRVLLKFDPDMKVRGAPLGSGGVGVFPGCLVGVKGRNGGGKLFSVSEVLMLPPMDATYTRPSELLDYQYGRGPKQLGGVPLSAFVAAGPYTVDLDLEYAPLVALLEQCEREKPDIAILLGPFVDAEHPLIKVGDVDQIPAHIFRDRISSRLSTLMASSPRTTVILIPSARDLISAHVAYPQSPFARDQELGLPKGVKLLPNPTTFSVNEVVFSITSLDVLFHLRNQELFRKCGEVVPDGEAAFEDPSAKDVMARTCRHLLRQRSFYPLFPAPLPGKGIDALNLDITHNDLVKMGTDSADVFILPSRLKQFAKVVDSTIMLNPSFLTRGNAAGTFARLTVHPMEKGELERRVGGGGQGDEEPDEAIEHRVWERCRVDVVKV